MKQPPLHLVAVAGTDLVITVHEPFRGAIHDPVLTGPVLDAPRPPQALSIIGSGPSHQIRYRWWVEGGLVTLERGVYQIGARHPYKSLFTAERGDAIGSVTATFTDIRPRPARSSMWQQAADGLEAPIRRTQQLHAQAYRLFTSSPSDDV